MTLTTRIPPPYPADSGEVTDALNIAGALWTKGDHRDAIRWVRRAAQAADEAGDLSRMTALARASAELEDSLAPPPPIQPSVPVPVPIVAGSTGPPPPASSRRTKPMSPPPPLPPQAIRSEPPETQLRVRVSIKTSVRDPTLLVVRRLDSGHALPAGTREGWLLMADATNVDVDAGPPDAKSLR
jgi:hypothetical protein